MTVSWQTCTSRHCIIYVFPVKLQWDILLLMFKADEKLLPVCAHFKQLKRKTETGHCDANSAFLFYVKAKHQGFKS